MKQKKAKATRKRYTASQRVEARKQYLKGYHLKDIATLLNIELRTLKRWRSLEKWKLQKNDTVINKKIEAVRLEGEGYRNTEIAKKLNVSLMTVWRYLKND